VVVLVDIDGEKPVEKLGDTQVQNDGLVQTWNPVLNCQNAIVFYII
jgi:hypothetical protein